MAGLWPAAARMAGAGRAIAVARPLVLTLALPPDLQGRLDQLRRQLYPEGQARAPAHLSLFRHLPGPEAEALSHDLKRLCRETAPIAVHLDAPVARDGAIHLPATAPALEALHADLADRWFPWLVPGDRVRPRFHISLAARLPAREAVHRAASLPVRPADFLSGGLLLWQHETEGWSPLVSFGFRR